MGKLVVYTGPMKCGKTTHLIKQYKNLNNKYNNCIFLKPVIDNRFSNDFIIDRDKQNKIKAYNINSIDEIIQYTTYKNIFIDEFQFLKGNICTINTLLELKCNLYVGGLDLTAEKKPFGEMGNLMCFADTIHKLRGNCDYCKKQNSGVYTLYEGGKDQDIVVGENNYKCVCSKCYIKYSNL